MIPFSFEYWKRLRIGMSLQLILGTMFEAGINVRLREDCQ